MRAPFLPVVVVVLGLVAQVAAHAQANVAAAPKIDFKAARQEVESAAATSPVPDQESARKAQAAEADYLVWSLGYRRSAFEWQDFSTKVTFWVVIGMIVAALVFSGLQFAKAQPTQSSLKLGKDGLEINSPVIGLLILIASIAFFYLYLSNVYPISEVGAPSSTQTTTAR